MTPRLTPDGHLDAEDVQRISEAIDTTSGPGPVLDQNGPAPMPLFNENERAGREVTSVIDPAEFAELSERSGIELDHDAPVGDEHVGPAGRAAKMHPNDPT